VSISRKDGSRTLGAIFPETASLDDWEAQLAGLSEAQGLDADGHSRERQQARGREDEPVADGPTITRTLQRRG
jgi:hypothetical protein